jgi:hypothetical protein
MHAAMYVLLSLGALVALLAFVVWERRRAQAQAVAPLARETLARGWSPQPALLWPVYAGLAVCVAALAVVEFRAPSAPPFAGRWSFAYELAYRLLGTFGIAYLWSALALVLLVASFVAWRARAQAEPQALPPNAL